MYPFVFSGSEVSVDSVGHGHKLNKEEIETRGVEEGERGVGIGAGWFNGRGGLWTCHGRRAFWRFASL